MELKNSHGTGCFRIILLAILLLFVLASCKKPLDKPETMDPIYRDLEDELKKTTSAKETLRKEIEAGQIALKEMEARDPLKRRAERELILREKKIQRLAQDELHLQLLIIKRRDNARHSYMEAFKQDKPWPNKEEWEEYQTNKRLRSASRNWADRIPKLQDHISKSAHKETKKKDAPAGH